MDEALHLKNQVCFPLYALSREVINRYRPFLDELDITYPQYLVMMVLWDNGLQTVNQVGDKLHLDSGTLTPLLKRLQQKGFISRRRSITDERVVELSVTDAGQALKLDVAPIPQKVVECMGISEQDLEELRELVIRILNKAKEKCDTRQR